MTPLSESAFGSLLADCSEAAFADFVADLWRARGREVRREGDHLVADGRALRPVVDPDDDRFPVAEAGRSPGRETVVVTATPPPAAAGSSVLGPGDLYRILLEDLPRERAAELFETHFDRPLDEDAADRDAGTADDDANAADGAEPSDDAETADDEDETAEAGVRGRLAGVAGLLSRGDDERRGLFGHPGAEAVAVAVLVVVAASLWVLAFYEPSPEPTEAPFATDAPSTDGNYRIVGQMTGVSDGERAEFTVSRTHAPGDPPVTVSRSSRRIHGDGTTSVTYNRGNTTYVRESWVNDSTYRDRLEGHHVGTVVGTSNSTQTIYLVLNRSGEETPWMPPSFTTGPLTLLDYERAGTTTYQGRDAVRYVPTEGWTASTTGPDSEPYTVRVRESSGEILVDAETGTLLYADVDATVVDADTWGEVLLKPDLEFDVEYRVEFGVDRPRTPPWVEGLNVTTGNETNASVGNPTAG